MRLVATIAVYLVTLPVVAVAMFFLVMFLAGPHGGVLPRSFESVVLILGWLCVLVLPILAARATWRLSGKKAAM